MNGIVLSVESAAPLPIRFIDLILKVPIEDSVNDLLIKRSGHILGQDARLLCHLADTFQRHHDLEFYQGGSELRVPEKMECC